MERPRHCLVTERTRLALPQHGKKHMTRYERALDRAVQHTLERPRFAIAHDEHAEHLPLGPGAFE